MFSRFFVYGQTGGYTGSPLRNSRVSERTCRDGSRPAPTERIASSCRCATLSSLPVGFLFHEMVICAQQTEETSCAGIHSSFWRRPWGCWFIRAATPWPGPRERRVLAPESGGPDSVGQARRPHGFGSFRRGDRPRTWGPGCGESRRAAYREGFRTSRGGDVGRALVQTPRGEGDPHARGRHGDDRRAARLGGELQRRLLVPHPARGRLLAARRAGARDPGGRTQASAARGGRAGPGRRVSLAAEPEHPSGLEPPLRLRNTETLRRHTSRRKTPLHILAVRDLEGARMPAAYVSLGVISTPEDEARLSETGEEDPYLTALAKEVLKFAGLTEDLPPKPPAPVEAAPSDSSQSLESAQQLAPSESEAAPSESPQPDASAPEAQNAAPAGRGASMSRKIALAVLVILISGALVWNFQEAVLDFMERAATPRSIPRGETPRARRA